MDAQDMYLGLLCPADDYNMYVTTSLKSHPALSRFAASSFVLHPELVSAIFG